MSARWGPRPSAERLQTGKNAMTHAMVITAVFLDVDGRPARNKVENSWGAMAGDKGFVRRDADYVYVARFVYQVIIPVLDHGVKWYFFNSLGVADFERTELARVINRCIVEFNLISLIPLCALT